MAIINDLNNNKKLETADEKDEEVELVTNLINKIEIENAISAYRAKKMLKLATIDPPKGGSEEGWLNNIKYDWLINSEIAGYHNLNGSPSDGIVEAMLLWEAVEELSIFNGKKS